MLRPTLVSALALVTALAACGTPQERCIASATRDLQVVNDLIAETEGNIARGYGYEKYEVTTHHMVPCSYGPPVLVEPKPPRPPKPPKGLPPILTGQPEATRSTVVYPGPGMCTDEDVITRQRPVSIDLATEKRKLEGLRQKQKELTARARAEIAACQTRYPEG